MTAPDSALGVAVALPQELHRRATDVASVCKEIVTKTAVTIQERKYVRVEGWMSIATAHGCTASARDVEKVEGGFRAIGEIRRVDTGAVIATAEGFVGEDEPTWFGGVTQTRNGPKTLPKRPDYAIRAMTQTRAISRACRTAFAHVVVMMDAGLSTTPAEEVPDGGFQDAHTPSGSANKAPGSEATDSRSSSTGGAPTLAKDGSWTLPDGVKWQDVKVHFGKNKGIPLGKLEDNTIGWYLEKWEPKPYGQNTDISIDDKMLLAAVNAWADAADEESGRSH